MKEILILQDDTAVIFLTIVDDEGDRWFNWVVYFHK